LRLGLWWNRRRDDVIRVRIKAKRMGDQPPEEIVYPAFPIQLPKQGDGVGTVESSSEDEQAKWPTEDLPTRDSRVGDREVAFLGSRDRRPAVNVTGRFFSYS
jgi:hypothetical protein